MQRETVYTDSTGKRKQNKIGYTDSTGEITQEGIAIIESIIQADICSPDEIILYDYLKLMENNARTRPGGPTDYIKRQFEERFNRVKDPAMSDLPEIYFEKFTPKHR